MPYTLRELLVRGLIERADADKVLRAQLRGDDRPAGVIAIALGLVHDDVIIELVLRDAAAVASAPTSFDPPLLLVSRSA